jgi:hypothetical protein
MRIAAGAPILCPDLRCHYHPVACLALTGIVVLAHDDPDIDWI